MYDRTILFSNFHPSQISKVQNIALPETPVTVGSFTSFLFRHQRWQNGPMFIEPMTLLGTPRVPFVPSLGATSTKFWEDDCRDPCMRVGITCDKYTEPMICRRVVVPSMNEGPARKGRPHSFNERRDRSRVGDLSLIDL
jgi:hypothetical protein